MNIIPLLYDIYDNYSRRKTSKIEYDYPLKFNQAIENNKKLNLDIPDFELDNKFNSDDEDGQIKEIIKSTIHNNIFKYRQEELAFNCFPFAEKAQLALKQELNIDSILTLGSCSESGTKFYYESLRKLKYRLNNKDFESTGINLHAWLTLPNYKIIDVTIISALKFCGKHSNIDYRNFYYLNSLDQNADNTGYSYHPILVGNDYIKKINLKPKAHVIMY